MKIESIAVLVDGSEASNSAVCIATAIASVLKAKADYVSIVDSTAAANFGSVSQTEDDIIAAGTGRIALDLAKKKAAGAGVECTTQIIKGIPHEVLEDLSRRHDLMVLGIDGWDDGTLHDDKQEITAAMNSACPVLTVGYERDELKRILLAVRDGGEDSVDLAALLAKASGAELRIMSAGIREDRADAAVAKAAERCRADGVEAQTESAKGIPGRIITEISKSYDLIVLDAEGARTLAKEVIIKARCPVLLVGNWSRDRH